MTVAILPLTTHISIIRATLERERRMRVNYLKGDKRTSGIAEVDTALDSLRILETAIRGSLDAK